LHLSKFENDFQEKERKDFIEKEQSDSNNYEQLNQKLKISSNSQFLHNDFTKIKISMDGNCLFRAILHFLCGIDTEHGTLRKIICDYIINHKEIYSEYFAGGEETLKQEIKEMSKDGVWGTIVELYAASELFISKSLTLIICLYIVHVFILKLFQLCI